ncbi:MAG: sensor histidine kinase [Treponema sp.]|jgi:two-component system sensor histidine kinase YesM|nr:sensor histidine kinase [Treponema sp.]
MVLVYTLIVAVPLAVAILIGTEQIWNMEYRRITTAVADELKEAARHADQCVELFMRIESAVIGNPGMDDFFLFTDKSDKTAMVFKMWALCGELERLQFSSPQVSIRIFVDDPEIPERWPVFFRRDRLRGPLEDGDSVKERRWHYGYPGGILTGSEGASMVSYTTGMLVRKRRIGNLQLLMPMADFFPFLERQEDRRYFVFSGGRALGESPESPAAGQILQAAEGKADGILRIRLEGKRRFFLWQRASNSDLLFVRDCSGELGGSAIDYLRIAAGTGVILSTVLLFLFIRFVTARMMGRLYRIMNSMGEIRRGNLDLSIAEEGNDEISGMAQSFNNMVARIRELIAQITEEQRLVAETELRVMQNQINSHFLYNALETIKMQAELAGESSVVESVTLLGRMLRYCLRSGQSQVSLREELEYIRSYIDFLNIRNDYRITLKEHFDPLCMDRRIPKMLIQPLVENAFHHAIEPRGEDALIELWTEKKEDALWINVRDYGPGIDAAELAGGAEEKGKGIGLRNIQHRLSAFYGPQWELRIENAPGGGALVRVPIPEQIR